VMSSLGSVQTKQTHFAQLLACNRLDKMKKAPFGAFFVSDL